MGYHTSVEAVIDGYGAMVETESTRRKPYAKSSTAYLHCHPALDLRLKSEILASDCLSFVRVEYIY